MSQEPIPIIKLLPATAGASELSGVLARSGQMEIFDVSSADEARQVAEQFLPCVLLISLLDFTCGHAELALVKKMEKAVRAARIKVIVLSAMKKHPLASEFASVGVTDFVEEPAPLRSLLFKANLAVKGVLAARRRDAQNAASEETLVFKASEAEAKSETTVGDHKPRYKPALQLGEDTFVFRAAAPRKMGKKFTLEAEGPDPEEGDWVADDPKARGAKRAWRWKPKGEAVSPERDGWIHDGEEPVFDSVAKKWQLRSEKPSLVFRRKGKTAAVKVETGDDGVVTLAEDSEIALRKVKAREDKAREAWRRALETKEAAVAETGPTEKEVGEGEASPEWTVKLTPGEELSPPGKDLEALNPEAEEDLPVLQRRMKRSPHSGRSSKIDEEEEESMERKERELAERDSKDLPERATRASALGEKNNSVEWNELEPKENPIHEHGSRIKQKAPAKRSLKPQEPKEMAEHKEDSPRDFGEESKELEKKAPSRLLGKGKTDRRERTKRTLNDLPHEAAPKELGEDEESDDSLAGRKVAREKARRKVLERQRQLALEAAHDEEEEAEDERIIARAKLTQPSALERAELALADCHVRGKARAIRQKDREEARAAFKEELAALDAADAGDAAEGELDSAEVAAAPVRMHEGEADAERPFRAIDSIEEGAGEVLWGDGEVSKREKKTRKTSRGGEGANDVLVPRPELLPLDSSWEKCGNNFAFIPNRAFAEGFIALSDVLPIWVYDGGVEPRLNEAEDHWCFRDQAPRRVDSEDGLPDDLRSFLLELKEQADLAAGADASGLAERLAREAASLPWLEERARARDTSSQERHTEGDGFGEEEASKDDANRKDYTLPEVGESPNIDAIPAKDEVPALGPLQVIAEPRGEVEGGPVAGPGQAPPPDFRFTPREILAFVALSDLAQRGSVSDHERRRIALAEITAAMDGLDIHWREGRLVADGCGERELYVLERFGAACRWLFSSKDVAA